ncbi:MAG: phosphoribosylformylglycinamidine synthase subunit PurL [Alphaproteobacteria bacterium]|nr:phosphoribosylformylglycinamidine synthase subunit PurL [Alphaproteobacteria bacterium]
MAVLTAGVSWTVSSPPSLRKSALRNEPNITPAQVAEHGLSEAEYQTILNVLGREPNLTELGIFSVMWSEHCSYKSSKFWLKTLPTEAPWVICGPGENAGVVDIGDGKAAIFKMESHNHPSFIEPYQGAATGVGGILRDVFTMGARPIANMNALRFGAPEDAKTRHLVAGVVAGVGGYGNCVGVPTVGGEVNFDAAYNGNILVNAMTVGLADADKIFYSAAAGIGNPVVYVGSKTGRDGIHGATMASAEFDDATEEKRPTVQVGDPFTEKLLIEACLELMGTDAIVAIQDMGAAGLTCSSVEMADKGGVGFDLDIDKVPQRETGMTPYEVMLSESQERMLMVLRPGSEDAAKAIFDKWQLDFAVVGRVTDTGRFIGRNNGAVVFDIPVRPLVDESPEYERPWVKTPAPAPLAAVTAPLDHMAALQIMLAGPDLSSRRWVWEQYDNSVMADTVRKPGGDAAIVRIHGSNRGLAITTDCTPRYCLADPHQGGAQAVAEVWRNLTAVGARPLAITDCLNFGNPERPETMGQLVGCIQGMGEACLALDFPVVSGNVSLYNETHGQAILPTPAIGGIGVLDDLEKYADLALRRADDQIILIGDTKGHLGQTIYLRQLLQRQDGPPPPVDLATERRNGDFVRGLIAAGTVDTCHDLSDGGLLVAAAEMAMAGDIGLELDGPDDPGFWFGEDQGRYLLSVPATFVDAILQQAEKRQVPAQIMGRTGGETLTMNTCEPISLSRLRRSHEAWLPDYMNSN